MTKEEEIKALVKETRFFKDKLATHLTKAEFCKDKLVKLTGKINWLSHLIRKGD